MHQDVTEAIDLIDATVFSGDTFYNRHDRDELIMNCERWLREAKRMQEVETAYVKGAYRDNL
jgi:hypothetical protein